MIDSSSIEKAIIKYRREKISSPTVDSTTDNLIQLCPLQLDPHAPMTFKDHLSSSMFPTVGRHKDTADCTQPSQSFIPIDSPYVDYFSQESGIKVETQSMLDDDSHFQGIILVYYTDN